MGSIYQGYLSYRKVQEDEWMIVRLLEIVRSRNCNIKRLISYEVPLVRVGFISVYQGNRVIHFYASQYFPGHYHNANVI